MAAHQTSPCPPEVPPPRDGSGSRLENGPPDFQCTFETHGAVQLLIDPLTGAIVDANDAAAGFYGWSRKQLRQMQIQDLDAPAPEAARLKIGRADVRPDSRFDVLHRRADGSVRNVAVFSGSTAPEGRGLLHFIVHDLTEFRQENRPRQAQKMEALCRLAESGAHDIKNMLQIILAAVEIAEMKLGPGSRAQFELGEIQAAVQRATEKAKHLLAFARQQILALQDSDPREPAE